jgi:O-antigen ligase
VDSALHLHSTPIPVWADLGLVGSVICFLLVGFILTRGLRILAGAASVRRDPFTIVLGSAVVSTFGYLAFSLTDFQFDIPVFSGLVATNLGIIVAAKIKDANTPASSAAFPSATLLQTSPNACCARLPVLCGAPRPHCPISMYTHPF